MQELLEKIREGLKNHEFTAYYQPQYDALSGQIISAEALVRWVQKDGSLLSPAQFIPFAEEQGIIVEIDWYMLESVCKLLKKQLRLGNAHLIAVNFSRRHLVEPNFVERLTETAAGYGVPNNMIGVELTETAMQEHNADTIQIVRQLRALGFEVAIDDFGSGMSSLKLVHDIDANVLKIDRSLLSNNCQNEKERIVLESILSFAQRLRMLTVAEGVETKEQLGFLRTCGCNCIQGYLFARPMPEDAYLQLVNEGKSEDTADILELQSAAEMMNLVIEAVFTRFPLIIMVNLSRNSYYMKVYENFTQRNCAASGEFDALIAHGSSTMHPEDQEIFRHTFGRRQLLSAYEREEKVVRLVTRQLGEDGKYRRVETADYFVKSPSSSDVLVVVLCQNLDNEDEAV